MNKGDTIWGIDIGGTKCAVLVGVDEGEVLANEEVGNTTFKPTCERILPQVEQLSKKSGDSLHGIDPIPLNGEPVFCAEIAAIEPRHSAANSQMQQEIFARPTSDSHLTRPTLPIKPWRPHQSTEFLT